MQKNVLLLKATENNGCFVDELVRSYQEGVEEKGGKALIVNVRNLHFTPMLNVSRVTLQNLEPDLQLVRNHILSSDHLVFFTEVEEGYVDFKFLSFFNRLFSMQGIAPLKNLWQPVQLVGKTVRVVSVLHNKAWETYQNGGRTFKHDTLNKQALLLFGFSTIRTTTMGNVEKGVRNVYFNKWLAKMRLLGYNQF